MFGLEALKVGNEIRQAKAEDRFAQTQAKFNISMAQFKEREALRRGEIDVQKLKTKTKQIIGAQRVSYAGQNVALDSGTPLDIQEETAGLSAEDAVTIRNNAWMEAFGYRMEANQYRLGAGFSRAQRSNRILESILTGGLQSAGIASSSR
jgi:hypothetical protein